MKTKILDTFFLNYLRLFLLVALKIEYLAFSNKMQVQVMVLRFLELRLLFQNVVWITLTCFSQKKLNLDYLSLARNRV